MTDPGLAPQRTRLAWRRTLLALAAVTLLSLRLAVHYGIDTASMLTAAAGLLLWLGALLVAHRRGVALATTRRTVVPAAAESSKPPEGSSGPLSQQAAGPVATTDRTLPLYAAILLGYAVLGTILVLTHLPD
jgi:hypothetical protein